MRFLSIQHRPSHHQLVEEYICYGVPYSVAASTQTDDSEQQRCPLACNARPEISFLIPFSIPRICNIARDHLYAAAMSDVFAQRNRSTYWQRIYSESDRRQKKKTIFSRIEFDFDFDTM